MTRIWRVIGPPGAGKTRYLSNQAAHAVDRFGTHAVAICSLTQTAAAAIAERVSLPEHHVATLHAHCLRSLGSPDLAEGRDALAAWNSAHPEHRRTGTGRGDQATAADRHHELAGTLRATLTPLHRWPIATRNYQRTWTRWKEREGLLDFTDLIEQAATTGLYGSFTVLLVDEAQDLSPLEWRVVIATAPRMHTVILAGDPAQALYGFRGADPTAMLRLQVTGERTLGTSWRCGQAIVDVARRVLRRRQAHLDVEYRARDGHMGEVRRSQAAVRNPDATLTEIRHWARHGTVMVAASAGHMLSPVIRELERAAIPFHNPYRPDHHRWNPMRHAAPLRALLAPDPNTFGVEAVDWWTWRQVAEWVAPMRDDALTEGARDLLRYRLRHDPAAGRGDADRPIAPDTLASLLADGLDAPPLHAGPDAWVDWWAGRLARRGPLQLPIRAWIKDPSAIAAEPRVIVSTAHSAKGGEADTVIFLPDASRSAWWSRDPGAITRTAYVGLTRARQTLLVGVPSSAEAVAI